MPLACLGPPAELTLGGARSGWRGTYARCGVELINATIPGRGRDRSNYHSGGLSLIWYFGENVYSQLGGANDPLATKPHGVVRVLWPEL